VLSERGLAVALEALALRAPVPVKLEAALDRRLPEQVEAAVYYVVAEGLANIHKHAGATRVVVRVASDETRLVVEVVDDGIGAPTRKGSGLRGLSDRVEALSGGLALDSSQGAGTRLPAELPIR
jgi:signal transduction histidine kinase